MKRSTTPLAAPAGSEFESALRYGPATVLTRPEQSDGLRMPGTAPGSRAGSAPGVGTGRAFGTFGELLQGALPGTGSDTEFLVTLPLARWTNAVFRFREDLPDVRVLPRGKTKSRQAAQAVLHSLGLRGGGTLELHGDLPEGKGLASSSADLVATVRAVAAAVGTRLSPEEIEKLLRGIEPTDGVMYDGIVAFRQVSVRLRSRLGTLPPLTLVAHDEGGAVDTVTQHRTSRTFSRAERAEYAVLLDRLSGAVACGDLRTVGEVATRSAEMNARRRPRPGLEVLRRACREVDGLGLVLAHSGTLLGVVLRPEDPALESKTAHVRAACRDLPGEVVLHQSLGVGTEQNPTLPAA